MNEVVLGSRHQRWPDKAFFKRMLWSAVGSVALGGLYAWPFEEHYIRIERHDMLLPGLGDEFCGTTIAHISDLHCSPVVLKSYLRRCTEAINDLHPDFVAITGDFITGSKRYARRVAKVLSALKPKIATVACLGNHDYGVFHPRGFGPKRNLSWYITERLSMADVFVMLNESRTFRRGNAAIQFVGLEDYWTSNFDPELAFDLVHPHLPTIALCHNPDPAKRLAKCGANWILAGHTHGTVKPQAQFSDLFFPVGTRQFAAGRYQLDSGADLYVNRGIAYGRRVSLNSRPEITLFTLGKG